MKNIVTSTVFVLSLSLGAFAQQPTSRMLEPDYSFTTIKANPITSIKNQARSGTCWAYSTLSFFESEVIRLCGIKDTLDYPDFSEFFVVSHSYMDRAEKYVRLDGKLNFAAGSQADDVLHVVRDYGLVPNAEMTGLNYGTELPAQAELDEVLLAYVSAVAKNPNRTLTTAWKRGFQAVLDSYFGECPETFEVKGVQYTPQTWRDALKINPDDYITLTSYTHHPFYTWFALEVADNWRWDQMYNVPIDELMAVLDNAIEGGFTVQWSTDVSHPGFTRNGLAILVDEKASKFVNDRERGARPEPVSEPKPEKEQITIVELVPSQETRQIDFDNKTVTDDHGMHIYGTAEDQDGKKYYMVKNSWGETGKYKGIWYATEAFVKNQTLNIMVHKDALTKDLKKKLGVK